MRTNSRLDEVFKEAFPIPFDDQSRFVFFSDIHRGDDSLSDEFGRNRHIYEHALDYYYRYGCTYIEVGDGDELWEHPNYDYIKAAHATTFNLLRKFYRESRLYMIYGNHNMRLRDPAFVKRNLTSIYDDLQEKNVDLFPDLTVHEALILKHRITQQEIFVVHGNQGDLLNDQLWRISSFLIRYLWRFMHVVGVKYAASPAKNRYKRHKVERNYNKWNSQHGIMLICGHTHRPRFPKSGEPAYFNTGCCMHPRGITCLELMDGKVSLVSWRVHSKPDGSMYIKRSIMQGPKPIECFRSEHEDRSGIGEEEAEQTEEINEIYKLVKSLEDGEDTTSEKRR